MHTLFTLFTIGLAILSAALTLSILRRLNHWPSRRAVQFGVLATPLISLGIAIGTLFHFAYRDCFFAAPVWDDVLAVALPVGMGVIAFGNSIISLTRLAFVSQLVSRRGAKAAPALQNMVKNQAAEMDLPCPEVRVCQYNHPDINTWLSAI